ncbi:hypothetical protein [Nocardioides sp. Leaf307]|uniref:hypothetical protein n=1 Tax=Nocardioides sp. Leaf307 TaxID=1736331 RepID=UPI000AD09A27|nr:hypothetical protein [Nocardioides sp. Leaf307]
MNLVVVLLVGWAVLSVPLGLLVAAVLRGPRRDLTPTPVATPQDSTGGGGLLVDVA